MSYIDRNLLPDEQILFRTRKHIIIFFYPAIISLLCFYAAGYMHTNPILVQVEWAAWLVAFIFWAQALFEFIYSDYAVTNKRVLLREGFLYRHVNETQLTAIAQVRSDQSLIGQMFNYGTVSIQAFGAADAFSLIADSRGFQLAVNKQL